MLQRVFKHFFLLSIKNLTFVRKFVKFNIKNNYIKILLYKLYNYNLVLSCVKERNYFLYNTKDHKNEILKIKLRYVQRIK